MKETSDVKSEGGEQRSNKPHFKKKGGIKNKGRRQQSTADEFFRGVGFSVSKEGPKLYLRTIERLGLYVITQFKNGSKVKICLMQEIVIKPEYPNLAKEHTVHKKGCGSSK